MKRSYSFKQLLLLIIFLLFIILLIGTIGFKYVSNISWLDALHNSAMYLSGTGPVYPMKSNREKIFSTFYAIIASILFLAIIIFIVDQILQLEIFNR
jgi:voltage-gated potassium channel